MMRLLRWALASVMLAGGCISGTMNVFYVQIEAANRATADIGFVIIDATGFPNHFGFLGYGGAGKTAGGCQLRFAKDIVIEWEEDGVTRHAQADLLPYAKKRDQIKNFTFRYLGSDRWEVIAKSGMNHDSPVVLP